MYSKTHFGIKWRASFSSYFWQIQNDLNKVIESDKDHKGYMKFLTFGTSLNKLTPPKGPRSLAVYQQISNSGFYFTDPFHDMFCGNLSLPQKLCFPCTGFSFVNRMLRTSFQISCIDVYREGYPPPHFLNPFELITYYIQIL